MVTLAEITPGLYWGRGDGSTVFDHIIKVDGTYPFLHCTYWNLTIGHKDECQSPTAVVVEMLPMNKPAPRDKHPSAQLNYVAPEDRPEM